MNVLVDSNVILDILTEDPQWFDWSSKALAHEADRATLVINPVIYAEISIGFQRIEELEDAVDPAIFRRDQIPWEAAFLAGKAFLAYRQSGGNKTAPLPDFFIGAHAIIQGMALLTRDTRRYKTYFPGLKLVAPG